MQNFSDYSNGAGGPPTVLPPVDKFATAPASYNAGRVITGAAGLATRMNPTSLAMGALNRLRTPDAPGTPGIITNLIAGATGADVPSKAATAANTAASDAFGMSDRGAGFDGSRVAPVVPPTGPSGNNGDAADWNRMADQLTGMTGMSREQTASVLNQKLPTDKKSAGEAAMLTTDGAARRLNYGYGSEIIGMGKTTGEGEPGRIQSGTNGMNPGPQRFNDFSGVGHGAMPAGPAGVLGPGTQSTAAGGVNGFDQAHAHIMSIMQQAEQKRAQGDGLGAKSLENHAARLGALFTGLSEHAFRAGSLQHQERVTNLAEQQAISGIKIDRQIQQFIANGDMESAARLEAIKRGAAPFAKKSVMPGTYGIDEYSDEDTRTPYPYFKATSAQ